jgi:hypothetical protein
MLHGEAWYFGKCAVREVRKVQSGKLHRSTPYYSFKHVQITISVGAFYS